jgi:Alginate lyase
MDIMRSLNLLAVSMGLVVPAIAIAQQPPRTVLMDGSFLLRERAQHDTAVLNAVRAEADRAMKEPATSVMDKHTTPPSGDKHDYMSLAPYWWPNPATPNHLPYIRKDGQHNPEASAVEDHDNMARMQTNVHALALAYFFTGDEAYAKRASLLLHVWFLDAATRMNPDLRYAQAILGVNDGRGIGVLDARGFAKVVDGLALLAGSSDWTPSDDAALREWFGKYFIWLTTSDNGKDEASQKNNHGNWYDVQAGAIALYLGKTDFARQLAETAKTKRVGVQIEPDGEQPLEEARTKSFGYCAFSLEALMNLAAEAQTVSVDLWDYKSPRGVSMRGALDYLVPFAEKQKQWQHETITGFSPKELREPLLMAAVAYRDAKYESAAKALKGDDDARALLLEREFAMGAEAK